MKGRTDVKAKISYSYPKEWFASRMLKVSIAGRSMVEQSSGISVCESSAVVQCSALGILLGRDFVLFERDQDPEINLGTLRVG